MKSFIFLALVCCLFSCQNNSKQTDNRPIDSLSNQDFDLNPIGVEKGCKWLKENIENYFQKDGSIQIIQAMTTPEYFEFKSDAINTGLEMDSSITEFELNQKWKNKFDLKTAGIGSGFLISGQDWKNIQVSNCNLINQTPQEINYKILISDCDFQTDYNRDIKLILDQNNQIKIADIKEYD